MTAVYIEKQNAPELPYSLVFWPNFRFPLSPKRPFIARAVAQYDKPFFELASQETADFYAVPYEYFDVVRCAPEYLKRVYRHAHSTRKKVLLFDYSDYADHSPKIPAHAVLFRVSAYRHHKRGNELIMPYFVEDIGARHNMPPKEREGQTIVGYCGYSQFSNPLRQWRAYAKRAVQSLSLRLCGDSEPATHIRGIFWRQRTLALLRKSGISCRFTPRPFYSGHRMSMTVDEETLRREYLENLRECDLALCVRGDSNQSQRFYEALSASRIPLLIDTDCVLPLEEVIDYDSVLLRVPSRELSALPACVRAWQERESAESFLARERRARELYEQYLRLDRYFAQVFDRTQSPYWRLLFEGESV